MPNWPIASLKGWDDRTAATFSQDDTLVAWESKVRVKNEGGLAQRRSAAALCVASVCAKLTGQSSDSGPARAISRQRGAESGESIEVGASNGQELLVLRADWHSHPGGDARLRAALLFSRVP